MAAPGNRLGAHQTNAENPDQYRHKSGPWQGNTPGKWGEGQAVFGDEAMPFAGLRPEIAHSYQQLAGQAKTADELVSFAKASGFNVTEQSTTSSRSITVGSTHSSRASNAFC